MIEYSYRGVLMKSKKAFIIIIVVIVLLIGTVFIFSRNNNKILLIESDKINTVIKEDDFVFLYNGKLNDNIKKFAKEIKVKNRVVTYQIELTDEEMKALSTDDIKIASDGYLVYVDQKFVGFISNSLDDNKKMEYVKKYLYGYIPEDERYYQVLSKADEYIKKFNSNEYTVAVFGSVECTWCTLYLPIVNDVARKHNLNIYYFEKGTYNETEYQKVLDIDFTIPAECTFNKEETSLGRKFDKPLTVITKNGKLEGCVLGYVTEDVLTNKLKEFKLVKGDK